MEIIFQYGPTGFSVLSAFLWIWSALIPIPDRLTFTVTKPNLQPLQPLGATYVGQATCPELEKNAVRLRSQARLNSLAAFSLAISIMLPYVNNFIK